MGADDAQAEIRRVKEDLESEKRRTKELQEQLDKALATASGVSVKNNVVFYAAGDGPLTSDELR